MSHEFVALLRCRIEAHGRHHLVVFAIRHLLVHAIDGTRRGIDEMTDAVVPARLKNVQKADEVALQVGIGIGDAIAHTGLCCKVDHLLKLFLLEECIEGGLIVDGQSHKTAVGQSRAHEHHAPLHLRLRALNATFAQTAILQPWVVIVVNVIDAHHFIASLRKHPHQLRANETSCTCNQYFHFYLFLSMVIVSRIILVMQALFSIMQTAAWPLRSYRANRCRSADQASPMHEAW